METEFQDLICIMKKRDTKLNVRKIKDDISKVNTFLGLSKHTVAIASFDREISEVLRNLKKAKVQDPDTIKHRLINAYSVLYHDKLYLDQTKRDMELPQSEFSLLVDKAELSRTIKAVDEGIEVSADLDRKVDRKITAVVDTGRQGMLQRLIEAEKGRNEAILHSFANKMQAKQDQREIDTLQEENIRNKKLEKKP